MENETLYQYFAGNATPEIERQILDWVESSDLNRQLFLKERKLFDALLLHSSPGISKQQNKGSRRVLFQVAVMAASVAASVALAIGYSIATFVNSSGSSTSQSMTVSTRSGQKTQITLPDGSQVWLNSSSKLTYPSDFNVSDRRVDIDGEAYFEVAKADKKLFIVATGEVETVVYGTSFNVKGFSEENTITVALLEGIVGLHKSTDKQQLTVLHPNEMVTINRKNLNYLTRACDAYKESLWHLNKLMFDNIGYDEMWSKLEGWYGVEFKVMNAKPGTTYRYTLKTETLTELLALINRVTPIDYTLNGEEVQVRYK